MIYGYARVSTEKQNLDRQLDALNDYGVDKIFMEKITGTKRKRPALDEMLEVLVEGDIVVIADLTRISRSTKDILNIVDEITERKATIKSLKDTWLDTTTDNPYNTFLLTIMSALSQLERELICARVNEGLQATKKKGTILGRPKVSTACTQQLIDEGMSISEACRETGISRSTYYKYREVN